MTVEGIFQPSNLIVVELRCEKLLIPKKLGFQPALRQTMVPNAKFKVEKFDGNQQL